MNSCSPAPRFGRPREGELLEVFQEFIHGAQRRRPVAGGAAGLSASDAALETGARSGLGPGGAGRPRSGLGARSGGLITSARRAALPALPSRVGPKPIFQHTINALDCTYLAINSTIEYVFALQIGRLRELAVRFQQCVGLPALLPSAAEREAEQRYEACEVLADTPAHGVTIQ